jgi:hypothetical protein
MNMKTATVWVRAAGFCQRQNSYKHLSPLSAITEVQVHVNDANECSSACLIIHTTCMPVARRVIRRSFRPAIR